jgi:hypothetical protein
MTTAYQTLRREIDLGLAKLQQAAAPVEDAVEEIVRVGVLLSLPLIGPEATIAGLIALTRQLEAEFPEHAKAARNSFIHMTPEGRA